jgi:pimeloyl-ACP methyl ester carboxylesterase
MTTSTIDTTHRPSTPRRTGPQPYFALLERYAPGLGARWAERIWFTLPRPRRAPPVGATGGHAFTVPTRVATVVGETWGSGPTVYLLHGWGGSRRQFGAFVAPLVDAGFRVVAFDAPSHGDSRPGRYGPRSTTALEFASALRAVTDVHGPPHAVIAHSVGGLATAVALRDGLTPSRAVLLAPVASMMGFVGRLREALGFGDRTANELLLRAHRRVGVHDRGDRTVPVSDGVAIAQAWPGARLHLTTGLGHHRLLADPDVVAEAVRFVKG